MKLAETLNKGIEITSCEQNLQLESYSAYFSFEETPDIGDKNLGALVKRHSLPAVYSLISEGRKVVHNQVQQLLRALVSLGSLQQ